MGKNKEFESTAQFYRDLSINIRLCHAGLHSNIMQYGLGLWICIFSWLQCTLSVDSCQGMMFAEITEKQLWGKYRQAESLSSVTHSEEENLRNLIQLFSPTKNESLKKWNRKLLVLALLTHCLIHQWKTMGDFCSLLCIGNGCVEVWRLENVKDTSGWWSMTC